MSESAKPASSHQPAGAGKSGLDVRAARRFFARSRPGGGDVLAREVGRRMAERLHLVRLEPRRVLDLGVGHGGDQELLATRYPRAQRLALDSAQVLLSRQGRSLAVRLGTLFGARRFAKGVCADFEYLPFAARSMQLVWSNLALAWSGDLAVTLREAARVLHPGGLIMFSTYGPDTLRELRAAFGAADGYPHVHDFVDMHDIGDMLMAAGFSEPVMDMEVITLTYRDIDTLVGDLRQSGQVNAAAGRRRGLTGRRVWASMRKHYEALRDSGRLPATFEVIYGHAWRAEPRTDDEGRSIIRMNLKSRQGAGARTDHG